MPGHVRSLINRFEDRIADGKAGTIAYANAGKVATFQSEYKRMIRPAYLANYAGGDFPAELVIQFNDARFNGEGGPGYVGLSMGVVNHPNPFIRTFAIAHETGHAVVYLECPRVGRLTPQTIGDGAPRHEFMADLIAMRVLMEHLPAKAAGVIANADALAMELGSGDFQHPSGQQRVAQIRQLFSQPQSFDQLIAAHGDPLS